MDGLATMSAPANVGSRDVAGNVVEQIDRSAMEMGDHVGFVHVFGVFTDAATRHQVRRNHQAQSLNADAGAIGDDEIA